MIRLAEILEVSVSDLLGAKIEHENVTNEVAEQLAIKNRRANRIWKSIAIVLAVFLLANVFIAVFFHVPDLEPNAGHSSSTVREEIISADA